MDAVKKRVTQARLKEVFNYDLETGVFTWRMFAYGQCVPGKQAGTLHQAPKDRTPHVFIRVDGRRYSAHMLAWLYVTGEWPTSQIDHINGDGADNAFSNLRLASHSQNRWNTAAQRRNTSGFKGVTKTRNGTWSVQIMANKKPHYLGTFKTPQLGAAAYAETAARLHGEYANTTLWEGANV